MRTVYKKATPKSSLTKPVLPSAGTRTGTAGNNFSLRTANVSAVQQRSFHHAICAASSLRPSMCSHLLSRVKLLRRA